MLQLPGEPVVPCRHLGCTLDHAQGAVMPGVVHGRCEMVRAPQSLQLFEQGTGSVCQGCDGVLRFYKAAAQTGFMKGLVTSPGVSRAAQDEQLRGRIAGLEEWGCQLAQESLRCRTRAAVEKAAAATGKEGR